MRINKKLNIVIPFEGGHVHSTPISREIFEKYFESISKAMTSIYKGGLGTMAGPRVASLMLKKHAIEDGCWEGPDGVESGLMNEIKRLSNVIVPGDRGWITSPYYDAIQKELLDSDEISEVENALVFFTLASAFHKKNELPGILLGANKFWGSETTFLNSTEYANSLKTLTEAENTGEKVIHSSIPS